MTRRFNPVVSSAPLKKLVLSGLLLSCSTAVLSMDLLQAYEAAKLQDATILAARATAQAGRENLPQALAQLLPNISASVGYNKNNLTSTTPNFWGLNRPHKQTTQARTRP